MCQPVLGERTPRRPPERQKGEERSPIYLFVHPAVFMEHRLGARSRAWRWGRLGGMTDPGTSLDRTLPRQGHVVGASGQRDQNVHESVAVGVGQAPGAVGRPERWAVPIQMLWQ